MIFIFAQQFSLAQNELRFDVKGTLMLSDYETPIGSSSGFSYNRVINEYFKVGASIYKVVSSPIGENSELQNELIPSNHNAWLFDGVIYITPSNNKNKFEFGLGFSYNNLRVNYLISRTYLRDNTSGQIEDVLTKHRYQHNHNIGTVFELGYYYHFTNNLFIGVNISYYRFFIENYKVREVNFNGDVLIVDGIKTSDYLNFGIAIGYKFKRNR